MKKKILVGSVSIIVLTGLILFSCKKAAEIIGAKEKYIAVKSGLDLRSGTDKTSSFVASIPFGSMVTIKKYEGDEIFFDGRWGKWVNINYDNKTGWVFSGFLCDFEPNKIIKIAADFYRNKNRKDELFSKYKEYTHFKDSEVSIENIIDNYIVLAVPMLQPSTLDLIKGNAVWKYDAIQENFFEVHNDKPTTIYLLYLDRDKYPDLIVQFGCCAGISLEILLGSENGFTKVYDDGGNAALFNLTVGNCEDLEFTFENKDDDGTSLFFRFNCNKREVEKYAEAKRIETIGTISSIDFKNRSVVIKGKEDLKDTLYKFYKTYPFGENLRWWGTHGEWIKLKKGDDVSSKYVILDGKKIIICISGRE